MGSAKIESIAFFGLLGLSLTLAACGTQQLRSSTVVTGPMLKASVQRTLPAPVLPATLYAYSDATSPLPQQFLRGGPGAPPPPPPGGRGGRGGRGGGGRGGPVISTDRTPADNPTTDAGATLGRVLFYDVRLSANDKIACASCHMQQFGFADTARLSVGLHGKVTARHAMALANARFYQNGSYFWDQRAASLEAQVLQPIQNDVEMGMSLQTLVPKLKGTPYYAALFTAAFGTPDISSERISLALAQFVRSMVSGQSKFDAVFAARGRPDFGVLAAQEQEGQRLYAGRAGCEACHGTNAQVMDNAHNTGLDRVITDVGAGGGRFKAPSLRNVAVRAPYMHDGRFETLAEVVEFYDHGVQPNQNLDRRLRGPNGQPRKLNLSASEQKALVAYLETLTDTAFLKAEKFSSPFVAGKVAAVTQAVVGISSRK